MLLSWKTQHLLADPVSAHLLYSALSEALHVVGIISVFNVCHARKKRIGKQEGKRKGGKSQECCCKGFTLEMLDVLQEYEKLKATDPDFYRAADSMSYGGAGKVPDANIDKMVAELNERYRLL